MPGRTSASFCSKNRTSLLCSPSSASKNSRPALQEPPPPRWHIAPCPFLWWGTGWATPRGATWQRWRLARAWCCRPTAPSCCQTSSACSRCWVGGQAGRQAGCACACRAGPWARQRGLGACLPGCLWGACAFARACLYAFVRCVRCRLYAVHAMLAGRTGSLALPGMARLLVLWRRATQLPWPSAAAHCNDPCPPACCRVLAAAPSPTQASASATS